MRLDKFSFQKQIEKKQLFLKSDVLLVAISGGMDSMVLVHLLFSNGYQIQLAHVNFGLRGEESDGDENFIREYAAKNNITLHLKRATEEEFNQENAGTQEAARNIRYRWFDDLVSENQIERVLLAHHQDDQSETILHQFLRGGMLPALRGMHEKSNRYVRPLLSFSKKEIENYATIHQLKWREDSSNQTSKYTRNFIRHEVMPVLQKVNADVKESIASRSVVFGEMEKLVNDVIQKDIQLNVLLENKKQLVSTEWLSSYSYHNLFLWQWLSNYGFTSSQMQDVLSLIESQSGLRVESKTHVLHKDRGHLELTTIAITNQVFYNIVSLPFESSELSLQEVNLSEVRFDNRLIQYIDLDKVEFPLIVRTWKEGDRINPLGMTGSQKVSDVLVQQKISITEKPNVLIVLDNINKTIAIPGLRVSNLVKIDNSTQRILKIELHP